jgi:hypothetical protein
MRARLEQTSNEPGASIAVRAVLTEYGVPVTARATCRAELTRPDNTSAVLTMLEVEPGVFQATTSAPLAGIYAFRIVAEGRTLRGRPFSREQTLTAAVWRGGDNPPPTSKDDPNRQDDRFCHLLDCLLRQRSIREALRKNGINWNELRHCLEEYCQKPSPRQPLQIARLKLEDRLRSVISDEEVFQAVMLELEQEKE